MKIAAHLLFAFGIATSLKVAVGAAEPVLILLPEEEEIRLALESGPEHLRAEAAVNNAGWLPCASRRFLLRREVARGQATRRRRNAANPAIADPKSHTAAGSGTGAVVTLMLYA